MKYYKVLLNNRSCVGSTMDWTPYLPKGDMPGEWTLKITGKLKLCEKGYHLTDVNHLLDWCQGNQLFEAEYQYKPMIDDNKIACRQVRLVRQLEGWNEKNLRLFACWCVREYCWDKLPDERSKNAVIIAEKFAIGETTVEELAAARAAAWDAASAAARDAAWDAENKKLCEMIGVQYEISN